MRRSKPGACCPAFASPVVDASAEARFVLDSDDLDSPDLQLMVFRRQDGQLTHLASGQEVWIGGLREMRMSGASGRSLAILCVSARISALRRAIGSLRPRS